MPCLGAHQGPGVLLGIGGWPEADAHLEQGRCDGRLGTGARGTCRAPGKLSSDSILCAGSSLRFTHSGRLSRPKPRLMMSRACDRPSSSTSSTHLRVPSAAAIADTLHQRRRPTAAGCAASRTLCRGFDREVGSLEALEAGKAQVGLAGEHAVLVDVYPGARHLHGGVSTHATGRSTAAGHLGGLADVEPHHDVGQHLGLVCAVGACLRDVREGNVGRGWS